MIRTDREATRLVVAFTVFLLSIERGPDPMPRGLATVSLVVAIACTVAVVRHYRRRYR